MWHLAPWGPCSLYTRHRGPSGRRRDEAESQIRIVLFFSSSQIIWDCPSDRHHRVYDSTPFLSLFVLCQLRKRGWGWSPKTNTNWLPIMIALWMGARVTFKTKLLKHTKHSIHDAFNTKPQYSKWSTPDSLQKFNLLILVARTNQFRITVFLPIQEFKSLHAVPLFHSSICVRLSSSQELRSACLACSSLYFIIYLNKAY